MQIKLLQFCQYYPKLVNAYRRNKKKYFPLPILSETLIVSIILLVLFTDALNGTTNLQYHGLFVCKHLNYKYSQILMVCIYLQDD